MTKNKKKGKEATNDMYKTGFDKGYEVGMKLRPNDMYKAGFNIGYELGAKVWKEKSQSEYLRGYTAGFEGARKFSADMGLKEIKMLIFLCHPDKHQNSEKSNEALKLLIKLKEKKECAGSS
tara:strand:+ start:899 stop:1261 length:363 start_codon:yes stop_codon:yes gene_type:complete